MRTPCHWILTLCTFASHTQHSIYRTVGVQTCNLLYVWRVSNMCIVYRIWTMWVSAATTTTTTATTATVYSIISMRWMPLSNKWHIYACMYKSRHTWICAYKIHMCIDLHTGVLIYIYAMLYIHIVYYRGSGRHTCEFWSMRCVNQRRCDAEKRRQRKKHSNEKMYQVFRFRQLFCMLLIVAVSVHCDCQLYHCCYFRWFELMLFAPRVVFVKVLKMK